MDRHGTDATAKLETRFVVTPEVDAGVQAGNCCLLGHRA